MKKATAPAGIAGVAGDGVAAGGELGGVVGTVVAAVAVDEGISVDGGVAVVEAPEPCGDSAAASVGDADSVGEAEGLCPAT